VPIAGLYLDFVGSGLAGVVFAAILGRVDVGGGGGGGYGATGGGGGADLFDEGDLIVAAVVAAVDSVDLVGVFVLRPDARVGD
jgi:hypothetical protein